MDEPTKAKIRKRARILHWVIELFLAIAMVAAALFGLIWWGVKPDNIFLDQRLRSVNSLVFTEFSRFYFSRGEQLIAYPPPEKCSERDAWAQKIIADFDQPTAVFVRDRCGLSWITRPPEMAMGIELLERVLASGAEKPDVVTKHVIGQMVAMRINTLTDTTGTSVVMVGPVDDSLRWGVVTHYWDTYRAFLKSLNDPLTVVGPRHPAFTLQKVIQLPSDPMTEVLPQLRASLNGEVFFESPRLDTTRHRFVFEHKDMREEFYATREAETQALLIARPFLSWQFFAALGLIMLVIHFYWLWIKKLTAPVS